MRKAFPYKNSKNHKYSKYQNHININNNDNKDENDNQFIFNSVEDNKNDIPVWMSPETQKIDNIKKRFHQEIIDYVNYITPKGETLTIREKTFHLLTDIIQKYKPDWKVVLFGSYSQNTQTIFSDLDFLILYNDDYSKNFDIKEMYNLMNILKKEEFSKNIRLVKARVPILKATCTITGINIDISMNRQNGCHAVLVIRKILKKYNILKPSIIILKILLTKFNLNESHSGGMNSYLLFHLVYFLLVHKFNKKNNDEKNEYNPNNIISNENDINNIKNIEEKEKAYSSKDKEDKNNNESSSNSEEKKIYNDDKSNNNIIINNNYKEVEKKYEINLSVFIILFLKYYGYEFEYEKYGFSLNDNNFGNIFNKEERTDMEYSKTICVESIIEHGLDVGKSCFNYEKIVNLFKAAYNKIKLEIENNTCSLLQSLGFPSI